jgi:hypothetical protein
MKQHNFAIAFGFTTNEAFLMQKIAASDKISYYLVRQPATA